MKIFDFFKKKVGSARSRKRPTLDRKQLQIKLRSGGWEDTEDFVEGATHRYVCFYSNGIVTIDNEV